MSLLSRTHGLAATYNSGCRCAACSAAVKAQRQARHAASEANDGVYPGSITHGLSGYRNYGCRCEPCIAAHRATISAERERRRGVTAANGGVAPISAHNQSTYQNWGCRCEACRANQREYDRQRRDAMTPGTAWD